MSEINLKLRHAKRQYSQNLDISNMNIDYLPNEVFQLKHLISLNLSSNNLKELSSLIENLVNLKDLNLENNQIDELPKEILNLKNLTNLNLKNNPILSKLKDFDIYWKLSLKNYFSGIEANSYNNSIINNSNYLQTETSNKNILSGNIQDNCNSNNNNNTKQSPNVNFSEIYNNKAANGSIGNSDPKLNLSAFSSFNTKPTELKSISFANLTINSNIPVNSNNNFSTLVNNLNVSNVNSLKKSLNAPGNNFDNISNNSQGNIRNNNTINSGGSIINNLPSSKKRILKEGEVLYKINKNSLKAFEDSDNNSSYNENIYNNFSNTNIQNIGNSNNTVTNFFPDANINSMSKDSSVNEICGSIVNNPHNNNSNSAFKNSFSGNNMNKTATNINFPKGKNLGNDNQDKEKTDSELTLNSLNANNNTLPSIFAKKQASSINSFKLGNSNSNSNNFHKISPVALKLQEKAIDRENYYNDRDDDNNYNINSESNNYFSNNYNNDSRNTLNNKTRNSLNSESNYNNYNCKNITTSNGNYTNTNISASLLHDNAETEKNLSCMEELEKKLKEKDLLISELNMKIEELQEKLEESKKITKNNFASNTKEINNSNNDNTITHPAKTSSNTGNNIKSSSFKAVNKHVEDEISLKRNWMDNNTSVLNNPGIKSFEIN